MDRIRLSLVTLIGFLFTLQDVGANTDIFLINFNSNANEVYLVNAKNITPRIGYDNQPHFAPNNTGLYFTQQIGKQTDLMFYDFEQKSVSNITQTESTSEYSPTVMPNQRALSFIQVEQDGTQRLWSQPLGQSQQELINQDVKPVGYHAWGASNDLALFVLGEPMTLQYLNHAEHGKPKIIANDIGRAIHFNSQLQLFSFTQGKDHVIHTYSPTKDQLKAYIPLPSGTQDYAWITPTRLIAAVESKVFHWNFGTNAEGWRPFLDLSAVCSTKITRIAANPNDKQLAIVCDEENTNE